MNHKKIFVPAILLIGIVSALAFAQPSFTQASASTPTPSIPIDQPANPGGPPLSLTISLLCFCLALLLIIGVFVLGVVVRRKGSADDKL